ncbi:MAG: photosynthetic reaction center subunit H [Polyangiaceae bacterium]|jgi:photosynthetic reaction center H subunit|nr:photosynthetic reaction center subunit H [Polyangiaceae bacterium]
MITEYIDVAQVVLYVFWAFFAGLVYWLRLEDRREGYPLETDNPAMVLPLNILIPEPKTFLLMEGGSIEAPNYIRDNRPIEATRTAAAAGSPLEPIGDPMLAAVGPGAFADRADHPEQTTHGADMIVPMRVATDFSITAGPDPRGWEIVAADGKSPGVVREIWVDRSDYMVRYLEVELADGGVRLVPMNMALVHDEVKQVEVASILSEHFAHVPTLKAPDRITLLEEDRICAFYAAGRLYATPRRLGPVV